MKILCPSVLLSVCPKNTPPPAIYGTVTRKKHNRSTTRNQFMTQKKKPNGMYTSICATSNRPKRIFEDTSIEISICTWSLFVLNDHRIDHSLEQMEVSVPLAALSERTNSHNLGTGAERHLGFGFGSIQYKSIQSTFSCTIKNLHNAVNFKGLKTMTRHLAGLL